MTTSCGKTWQLRLGRSHVTDDFQWHHLKDLKAPKMGMYWESGCWDRWDYKNLSGNMDQHADISGANGLNLSSHVLYSLVKKGIYSAWIMNHRFWWILMSRILNPIVINQHQSVSRNIEYPITTGLGFYVLMFHITSPLNVGNILSNRDLFWWCSKSPKSRDINPNIQSLWWIKNHRIFVERQARAFCCVTSSYVQPIQQKNQLKNRHWNAGLHQMLLKNMLFLLGFNRSKGWLSLA